MGLTGGKMCGHAHFALARIRFLIQARLVELEGARKMVLITLPLIIAAMLTYMFVAAHYRLPRDL